MKTIKEIIEYREMIFSLIRRDLRGRYKGSVLGFMWTFINPLLQLGVYTVVFSIIMRMNIDRYYLFLFVALIPWMFFNTCLGGGTRVIFSQEDMVKKIYFPREVLPVAFATSQFVNMVLAFVVIFAVVFISGMGVSLQALLYLPLVMAIEYILALGITMFGAAATVYIRDLEQIFNIIGMAWMYMTPVLYSVDMVPEELRGLYHLNPMTSIIVAYRDILYYKRPPQLGTLLNAVLLGLAVLAFGCFSFSRLKRRFAEEL
ncbi:MAG: ABC transporter permease [Lachnospiraceae bacterium]|nr:ABC transporter permease [Lachnospiraceae bacterium]